MESKFYQRIKEIRESKGLTQKQLAEQVNVSPGSLSAYENGNKTPPVDVAARIAKVLGVSLDWLFGLEKGKAVSQLPSTYADVARYFLLMSEVFPIVYPEFSSIENPSNSRISELRYRFKALSPEDIATVETEVIGQFESRYASFDIPDRVVARFFESWKKFYELRLEGILDDEVYNAWIEKRLYDLSLIPLNYTWPGRKDSAESESTPEKAE